MTVNSYPGGSRSRVNRAGDNVRNGVETPDDLKVIEEWRAAHKNVLNTFQAILHNRANGKNIAVAQRHKRKTTVFDKLSRQARMSLSRMDDVAGCRLIFENIQELRIFRENLHKARFRHKRRNDNDKYDYIKKPKATGYRGIHDIYEYDVNSESGRHLAGLYVEVQYRTLVQHAWSTANEVLAKVTTSEPKFQRGDERILRVMQYASEILARAHEGEKGPVPDLADRELVQGFIQMDQELGLLDALKSLHPSADENPADIKNIILVFKGGAGPDIHPFRDASQALRELFRLENEHPDMDIVLVGAGSKTDVRLAFTNYFSDVRDFINLVESACARLTGEKDLPWVQQRRYLLSRQPVSKGPKNRKQWWKN